ncbi:MAG TPA: C10 family peptidase [Bacteroidales bacterium]|nr:C10 family peptidase [Bacteroidales bacterium]
MKRTLIIVLAVLLVYAVQAKKVDLPMAKKVGIAYYYEHAGQFVNLDLKTLETADIFTESAGNTPLYYIINLNPRGFVIVAADDNVTPVIGYSYESYLNPEYMPENVRYWMSGVRTEILRIINKKTPAYETISSLWNYYATSTPDNLTIKKSKAITPLLSSMWNQDKYYNQFCPADTAGPDDRTYAGCVATAMAQVMYYYRYPVTGQSSHGGINFGATTYQWDNMLDELSNYNEAVATLIYHCGRAVNMDYAADGSSASSSTCTTALKNYFKYDSNCDFEMRYLYSNTAWANLLKANLDAKHPMIYSGSDGFSGGHAWNCDGYDASSNFHMNWGWGGYANGYFAITDLTAAGSSFNDNQGVVRNIYPLATSYPYNCSGTKSITGITGTIEDGSGPNDYPNNSDCLWLIDPSETVSKISLEFTSFSTQASSDVVTVYDGSTTASPVLGTFSGSTLPPVVSSTGPVMLVRFQTNSSTTNTGWRATYRSSFPVYCSGISTLTASSGTVADGSGADNYTYNHLCRWSIAPPNAASITLNFTAFNLSTNDFLRISDQNTSAVLNEYTGTTVPAVKTYNTSKVLVMFKSDTYLNSQGFSLNYTSSTQLGLEENGNLSGMNIFPNPAKNILNVQFTLHEPENLSVELCSMTGVVVYKEEQYNFDGNYHTVINTSGLSQGVYLLRITGDTQSVCKKIIIE